MGLELHDFYVRTFSAGYPAQADASLIGVHRFDTQIEECTLAAVRVTASLIRPVARPIRGPRQTRQSRLRINRRSVLRSRSPERRQEPLVTTHIAPRIWHHFGCPPVAPRELVVRRQASDALGERRWMASEA